MPSFVAKILFRIEVANHKMADQFEELTVLIEADNKQNAYQKAMVIGQQNEDEFLNCNKNKVLWKLQGITHLFQLNTLTHGSVLFSELKDDYSAEQKIILGQKIDKLIEEFKTKLQTS